MNARPFLLGVVAISVVGCGGLTSADAEGGGDAPGLGGAWPSGGVGVGLGGAQPSGGSVGGTPLVTAGSGGERPPTNCVPLAESISGDYCHVPFSCNEGHLGLVCDIREPNASPCTCTGSMATVEYRLLDTNGDPCGHAVDFCPTLPSFNDPETCEIEYRDEHPDGCELVNDCTWSVALEDGVTLQDSESDNTSCQQDENGWKCTCSAPDYDWALELPGNPTSGSACTDARSICRTVGTLSERQACFIADLYSSNEQCRSELECERMGTCENGPILLRESIRTTCVPMYVGTNDLWTCVCDLREGTIVVDLEASMSAADACAAAPMLCLEHLDAAESEP